MTDSLLRFREELPVTESCVYLNHAGTSPPPGRAVARMAEFAEVASRTGDRVWNERQREAERVRGLTAKLMGAAHPHEIAFVENTSSALSMVAEGLDWQSGDNVVGAALEFPSNVYPWMSLAARGVEYRQAEERDGRIDPGELLSLLDDRTRMLALSWVQYASGFRSDLNLLGRACRERGVLFVVDVIQGLGALTLDVERDLVDVAAASSHKWLLGVEGLGVLYVSDRVIDRIRPVRSGWRSMRNPFQWTEYDLAWNEGAKRFESGTLNIYGIAALGGSLDILYEAGPEAVERRVLALADRSARGLEDLGFTVVSSRRPGETSGIVAATHPSLDPSDLVRKLAGRDIVVAARAGRFRLSPHFYNTEEEIDRCLTELASLR
ncbi:MAG TPA: aminotransferase class V-fold PLP-dependent enzyme [Thermoanaerobaculia bacterium]|jgi:selenocysteine lyase/cysteine desulfurase|nr:aminotransferase class V-fold PLP-dependent enzyme [Thermoanaerobaculia bacterium]